MFNLDDINQGTISKEDFTPIEVNRPFGGHQIVFRFPNNLGASVVRHNHSYGGPQGLRELVVIGFSAKDPESKDWVLTYETAITCDVIGYLTEEDVSSLLIQIQALEVSEELVAHIEEQIAQYLKSKANDEDEEEFEEILLQELQDKESGTFVA